MLYVFRVDTGTMLRLDMNLALETVAQLKEAIERCCRLPADKQVLLVNGGEWLEAAARVCTYSAGTDTNPIYLFSRSSQESRSLSPSSDYGSDNEVTQQVEKSLELPSTYNTVVARVALAQRLWDLARDLVKDCESLVHDQHLQQQGWAAAVANLEDTAQSFRQHSLAFEQDFKAHLEQREENLGTLTSFNEDLSTLGQIPILPSLLQHAIPLSGLEEGVHVSAMTLFQWISAKDNQSSLQQVATHCAAVLEQLDEAVLESMKQRVDLALEVADKTEMKEIGGLSERLCGLEQMMARAKRTVQEQQDLALGFQQNQIRASDLRDASILPDLCLSHRRQLLVMLENQSKLKDIRRRCHKAKEELSENLLHRLRWVACAQSEMVHVSDNLMIYQENLKRGRRHLMIVRQVQRAPEMYCLAVAEVVRRKTFSQAFLKWATDLSCRLLATYNEETERRREFKMKFSGHFLEALFPGLDDEPPTFAISPPDPFDSNLPELTVTDMATLRTVLPDLALTVSWTELSNVAQMLLSKTQMDSRADSKDNVPVEDRLVAVVSQAGLGDRLDEALLQDEEPMRTDNRDVESEPDTDEFEKVSQSLKHEEESQRVASLKLGVSYLREALDEMRHRTAEEREDILHLAKQIQIRVEQLKEGYEQEVESMRTTLDCTKEECLRTNQQLIEARNLQHEEVTSLRNQLEQERQKLVEERDAARLSAQVAQESLDNEKKAASETMALALQAAHDSQAQSDLNMKTVVEEHNLLLYNLESRLEGALNELTSHKVEADCLQRRLAEAERLVEEECGRRLQQVEERHLHDLREVEERLRREAELKVTQAVDALARDHRTEIASLRSRFRLVSVTAMEKSPSDSSLEKIERGDVIELVNHEAILAQAKVDAEEELEKAVSAAVDAEHQKSREEMEEGLRNARVRMELEKQVWLQEAVTRALAEKERELQQRMQQEKQAWIQEAVAEALAEKDRQMEALTARYQSLGTECQRHRDTIRLLTDGEPLLSRVDALEREKRSLQNEVSLLRAQSQHSTSDLTASRFDDMAVSVALDTSTSSPELPHREHEKLVKTPREAGKICIGSCATDDLVLVVWSQEHVNYMVLQECSTLFFLHSDCLDVLGLRPASDGSPRRLFATAIVVNKEYCHAKKSENRYRVPKGTKFYRVVVRPATRERHDSSLGRKQS